MSVEPLEVAEEYRSSLVDLTVNSKPLITMLTMLAEENKDHASTIIGVIEDQIHKAPSNQKLPVMYLIDSIVKNVGDHYTRAFSNNLVKTFGNTFEKVDERTRKKLYELRQTWNDVFPGSKLYMMDVKVNALDPAWPITSQQPSSNIHINPKMINKKMSKPDHKPEQPPSTRSTENKTQFQEITRKKEQLLDIEKRKLAMMKKQLEIQAVPKEKKPVVPEPLVDSAGSKEKRSEFLRSYKIKKKAPTEKPEIKTEKTELKVVANIYVNPRSMNTMQLPPSAALIASRDPRLAATPDSPVSPSSRDPRLATAASTPQQENSPIKDSPTGRVTRASQPTLPPASKRPDPRLQKVDEKEKDISHKKKDKDDREKRKKDKEKEKEKMKDRERYSRRDKDKSSSSGGSSSEKSSTRSTIVSHREKDKKDKEALISSSTNTMIPPVSPVMVPANLLTPPPGIKPLNTEEDSTTVFNKHKSNKGRKQHVRSRRSESPDEAALAAAAAAAAISVEAAVDTTAAVATSTSPSSSNKKRIRSQEESDSGDSDDYQANKPNPAVYHNKKVRKGEVSSSSSMVYTPTNISADQDGEGDVDLRKLTPTGKRPASSTPEDTYSPPKKEKLHLEEEAKEPQDPFGLFSGQDVDLRQILPRPNMGPLAPPPGPPELPPVFTGVVDQEGAHLSNLDEGSGLPLGIVSPLSAVMDHPDRKQQNVNTPNAAKWKQFREKNPEFKEYQRQASTSDSDKSFHLEGGDEESIRGSVFSEHGRGRGNFRSHSDPHNKRSSTERKRLTYEDEEGESSPAHNEATKRNYQVIVSQAEEQMQRGEITMSQYNQLLQTVVSLVEQDKIKEARAENKQSYHGDDFSGEGPDDIGLPEMHQAQSMARGRGGPYMDRGRGFGRGGRGRLGPGTPPGVPTAHGGPSGGPIDGGGRGSPMDPEGHAGMIELERMRGRGRGRGRGDRGGPYMDQQMFNKDDEFSHEPELPEPSKEDFRLAKETTNNLCQLMIDQIMREIRIYGTTVIALMERDDPRELTFEDGKAKIVFEGGKFILPMHIGEPYKEFKIDGEPHRVRLGVPTRELFLDGVGYQCFYGNPGNPIQIFFAGKNRRIALDGKAPNVKIAPTKNFEFCCGRIEMVIDAKKIVPLYLDARPQRFFIDDRIYIIRFIDKLRLVKINGKVFPVEFGGRPICLNVRGSMRYISFQPLPKGIIAGQVTIRNMEDGPPGVPGRPKRHSPTRTEGPPNIMAPPLHPPPLPPPGVAGPRMPVSGGPPPAPLPGVAGPLPTGPGMPLSHPIPPGMQPPPGMPLPGPPGPLGPHSQPGGPPVMPPPWLPPTSLPPPGFPDTSMAPPPVMASVPPPGANNSYHTNLPGPEALVTPVVAPPRIDLSNLVAGLMKAGLIGNKDKEKRKDEADEKRLAEEEHLKEEEKKIPTEEMFNSDNLRKRRSYLIHGLYNGMQCSSCGLRYPPEQTLQYSHHLDWHFRQNKKQQESTKKANARRFYFSIEDWLQYEEIEDVEERAPSKFELDGMEDPMDTSEAEIPSVKIDESDESLGSCSVCHDIFNKFYHQDTEEWRFHNSKQVEGVNYHPSCHEDMINAQLAEEKAKEEKEKAEAEAKEEKEKAEVKEGETEMPEAKEGENPEAKEGENPEAKEGENPEAKEGEKEKPEAKEGDGEKPEENKGEKPEEKEGERDTSEAKEGEPENSEATLEDVENAEKTAVPTENGLPNGDSVEKESTNDEADKENEAAESEDRTVISTGENVVEPITAFQMVPIKEEPLDTASSESLSGGIKIKEEPGLDTGFKIKDEPQDVPEDEYCLVEDPDENLDESWIAPATNAIAPIESDITSTIDGNMELTTPETTQAPSSVPKIKISISKPTMNNNSSNNNNKNKNTDGNGMNNNNSLEEDDFVPPPFTVDLDAKPHFRGVELEDMPLQCRGLELSGLCSIM